LYFREKNHSAGSVKRPDEHQSPEKQDMTNPSPGNEVGTNFLAAGGLTFVIFLGVVSLFADFTYEGARSITGPYLAILGASATAVGIIAGLGEFLGYGFRLVSGYLTDKTGKYWTIVIIGYAINLLAVPLLALAGNWQIAALLILTERMGKASRIPGRDAMLAKASERIGAGRGFGLHQFMDQTGALIGPLVMAGVLYWSGNYRLGFAVLLIPAIIALSVLAAARMKYPEPKDLHVKTAGLKPGQFPRAFWLYTIAAGLVAAGYADFALIAYHFEKARLVANEWIPVFYAVASGTSALSSLFFGRMYDRLGLSMLMIAVALASLFAPLVFLGGTTSALVGMALWGLGVGAQGSIMKAAITGMVQNNKLALAYGMFDTGFGFFWFAGSALMGVLYDVSILYLVIFSVAIQLASIPLLLMMRLTFRAS
jgi:MFS family permease